MSFICPHCGWDRVCKRCWYRWRDRQSAPDLPFCFRCTGWGYERFHSCCRVTDLISGPDLNGQLRHVLSRPDAAGVHRSVTVHSTATLLDPISGIPARPSFADHYVSADPDYESEVYALFPQDHHDPTLGFAQLLSVTVSEVCTTRTSAATSLGVVVGPASRLAVSLEHLLLREDVLHLLVHRYFLGTSYP